MKKVDLTYVVDDDPIQCFLIKKMLEEIDGFGQIESYPNGKIALDIIKDRNENQQNIPKVIFLDINMPVMDGWEFLNQLRKENQLPNIPIFIITSSIDTRDFDKAKRMGDLVKGYIVKPADDKKLREVIKEI